MKENKKKLDFGRFKKRKKTKPKKGLFLILLLVIALLLWFNAEKILDRFF